MDLFSDLDDLPEYETAAQQEIAPHKGPRTAPTGGRFVEVCSKCHGSGIWQGRGQCFACKGRGQTTFARSAEDRAKDRAKRAAKKEKARLDWANAHKAEIDWMYAKAPTFSFARSMVDAVAQYGELTENQLATVQRLMAADAERSARFAAERAEREANAPKVSAEAVETSLRTALSNGLKNPKLRLDTFTFSLAKAHSKNAGAIYVTEDGEYLGKIVDGKFVRVWACKPETETRVVCAASNPAAAAEAYGRRTGSCSCCGRELTAADSIARAIGPICASKFGL
jgi:hypothetical protein